MRVTNPMREAGIKAYDNWRRNGTGKRSELIDSIYFEMVNARWNQILNIDPAPYDEAQVDRWFNDGGS